MNLLDSPLQRKFAKKRDVVTDAQHKRILSKQSFSRDSSPGFLKGFKLRAYDPTMPFNEEENKSTRGYQKLQERLKQHQQTTRRLKRRSVVLPIFPREVYADYRKNSLQRQGENCFILR